MIIRFFFLISLLFSYFLILGQTKPKNNFSDFILWKPIGNTTIPKSFCKGNEWTGGVGRVESIWRNPHTSTIYIGSNNGGLWKKQQNSKWECLTDSLPSFGVRDILVSPVDSQKIFIATGIELARGTNVTNNEYGFGIYFSEDGGETWGKSAMDAAKRNELFIQKLVIDPTNYNHLYALSLTVLYESIDEGKTWSKMNIPFIKDTYFQDIEFHLNQLFLTTLQGTFFYSEDNGKKWNKNTNLSHKPMINLELATSQNSLYAIYCHSYKSRRCSLKKSTDGGKTWKTLVRNQFLWTAKHTPFILEISPTDTSKVYLGAIKNYVYQNHRFIQSGNRQMSKNNYLHDDIRSIEIVDSAGTDIVYVGTDGGISKSSKNGNTNTWKHIGDGLSLGSYYSIASNSQLLIGGAHDASNDIFYHNQWKNTSCISGDGGSVLADQHQENQVYVFSNSTVYKGSYQSKKWELKKTNFPRLIEYDSPLLQHPYKKIIYAGEWNVKVSYDEGKTIENLVTLGKGRVVEMAISSSNPHVFYYSRVNAFADRTQDTSFLYRRSNDGKKWKDISTNLGDALIGHRITGIKIHPRHSDTVWVTLNGFENGEKVYQSYNGGKYWENISFDLINYPIQCIQYDAINNNICVGTDQGIFYKPINGNTWNHLGNLSKMVITSIEINEEKGMFYISSYGRGIWEAKIPNIKTTGKNSYIKNEVWKIPTLLRNQVTFIKERLTIDTKIICDDLSKIKLEPNTKLIISSQGELINAQIKAGKNSEIIVQKGGKLNCRKNQLRLHKTSKIIYE